MTALASALPSVIGFGFASMPVLRINTPYKKRIVAPSYGNKKRAASRISICAQLPDDQPPRQHVPFTNLNELTERISDLLDVGSLAKARGSSAGPMLSDERMGHLNASLHIVVIFGKRLIRDQVSVEYAKRIVTLVKQLATKAIDPDIICFTGGRISSGNLSEAMAGYSYFRSVAEESSINVDNYTYMLEEKSFNTVQNIQNVIGTLKRRCEAYRLSNVHFTLISSDYHLIRLQEVHRLNSHDSALHPLTLFNASWSYIFAAYPFCVSREPSTAFLGRAIVLANDLSIVLVNLNCAVNYHRFMAKENLHRLQETFAKMRDMYRVIDGKNRPGFRTNMRKHAETLELAIHRVREVNTILLPLQEDGVNISTEDLELAQRLLMTVVRDIRESMDPDRVLVVTDRVAVANDLTAYIARECPSDEDDGDNDGDGGPGTGDGKKDSNIDIIFAEPDAESSQGGRNKGGPRRMDGHSKKNKFTSELAGHEGVRFAGNGKRIGRDGPNLVVLDENSNNGMPILDGRESISVLLDNMGINNIGDIKAVPTTPPSVPPVRRRRRTSSTSASTSTASRPKRPRGRPPTRNTSAASSPSKSTSASTGTTRKKRSRATTKRKLPRAQNSDGD